MPSSTTIPSSSMLQRRPVGGGSLKCTVALFPPAKQVGEGDDALVYQEQQPAWQCCFSRDGRWLAVCYGSPDPCVRIWKKNDDNDEWKLQTTLRGIHERTVRSVAFAPVNEPLTLASGSFDGTVTVWEYSPGTNDWECMAQLEGHDSEVKFVAWNSTGSLLATCGRDKTVWIWECFLPGTVGGPDVNSSSAADQGGADFECLAVLNGHTADVKCALFVNSHGQWGDGDEILLSASYDDSIKIWAEDAGEWYCAASLSSVHSSTIWTLTASPSGSRLISGSADGSLAIYKCYSAAEKKRLFPDESQNSNDLWKCVGKLPDAHSCTVYSVDYASSRCGHGRVASGGADNCIQIYREAMESTSDQPMFLLDACVSTKHGDVNCVCWHPWDGSVLASAGDDGAVRLWKYKT